MSQTNVTLNFARVQDPTYDREMKGESERENRRQNAKFGCRTSERRLAYSFAPYYRELIKN